MKQSKISLITKRLVEEPLEFTNKVLEHSEQVKHPSPKLNKIGSTIGIIVGFCILATGICWFFYGKPLWGISGIILGPISILTNWIGYHNRKKKDSFVS